MARDQSEAYALSGCRFEREAKEPAYYCRDCGDVEVSEFEGLCAECEVQHICATCGGRIDPGDVYCSDECRAEDEAAAAGDARADLAEV